jgi:hypothetical protein
VVNAWGDYYADPARQLHADIPSLDFVPVAGGGELLFVSTDGGTYYSTDGGVTVQNLSLEGLRVSQYYSTLSDASDTAEILAGSQDQGYQSGRAGAGAFEQLISGDYGQLTSPDGTHAVVYSAYPGFVLVSERTASDTRLNWSTQFPPGESHHWLPALAADPEDPGSFYFCATRIYRYTRSGDVWTWSRLPFDFRQESWEHVSALAIAAASPNRWYAGTNAGRFWYSTDRGGTWTRSTFSGVPAPQYLTGLAIAVDPLDPQKVTVGGAGYSNPGVYRSTDGGRTFSPLGTAQPQTLFYDLATDPVGGGDVYAATESGPYRFRAATGAWESLLEPPAPLTTFWSVERLPDRLRFGTYGRGIWDYVVPTPAPTTPSGFRVTGTTATGASLGWNDVGDESGYRVYKWNGSSFAVRAQVGADVTAYTDAGLHCGTQHTYRVTAFSGAGESSPTASVTASTQPCPSPPAAATPLSPSGPVSTRTPSYVWSAAAGADEYYLYVADAASSAILHTQWYQSSAVCAASNCSVTPSTVLPNAGYRWWVQTRNAAGTGPWSAGMNFTVSAGAPPGASSPMSPSGTVATNTPTFTFSSVNGADEYYLYVANAATSAIVHTQWYPSSTACGAANCSVTPATTLPNAGYRWWVQTRNAVGTGPWSAGMSFTVSAGAPPGASLPISPSGTVTTNTPAFTFARVTGADEYYLYVANSVTSAIVHTRWYAASAVCGAGNCSVTPATTLPNAGYRWWIQTRNAVGIGPWSPGMNFTVSAGTAPGASAPISPSGTVTTSTPPFTFAKVPGADEYYLYVSNAATSAIVHTQWYQASAVCGASDCSVTPSVTLPSAGYRWWIQTRNTVGTGPWSAGMNFTVSAGAPPGASSPMSPSGTIATSTPTFTFSKVTGADDYYLYVAHSASSTIVHTQWYPSSAVCGAATCSVTPATPLGSASYRWWIQTRNAAGTGPWSAGMDFTVQ